MATRYAELVERLKPSWRADEDASRAASLLRSTSPALVERLNASIVANNEIKAEAAAAITALEAEVEQAFRDGLAYATNCVVTDPDEAWRTSRAPASIESKP